MEFHYEVSHILLDVWEQAGSALSSQGLGTLAVLAQDATAKFEAAQKELKDFSDRCKGEA